MEDQLISIAPGWVICYEDAAYPVIALVRDGETGEIYPVFVMEGFKPQTAKGHSRRWWMARER